MPPSQSERPQSRPCCCYCRLQVLLAPRVFAPQGWTTCCPAGHCLGWAAGDHLRELAAPDLLPGFDLKLGESGPNIDVAKSIAANIDTLEQLERMIAMMEQRRNAAYHQAEQHRANLGNRLRQAV